MDGQRPPPLVLLWRGFTKACPQCGRRRLFDRWTVMVEECPRCGLRFERTEGHWIGAIGMNTIVSFGVLLAAIVGGVAVTYPDIPAVRLSLITAAGAALFPVFFYPFSKTLWTAIDIWMRPVGPDETGPPR